MIGQGPYNPRGEGYQVRDLGTPANEYNSNGVLHNRDLSEEDPYHKIHLYVTSFQTGWSLAGESAQANKSKTFYPKHLQQDEVLIQGMCPSQFEYDRIVAFVNKHHYSCVTQPGGRNRVDFKLLPAMVRPRLDENQQPFYETNKKWALHPSVAYGGTINTIKAGHERFQFYPTFEIKLKVTLDYLSGESNAPYPDDLLKNYQDGLFAGTSFYTEADGPNPSTGQDFGRLADVAEDIKNAVNDSFSWLGDKLDFDE